jgi:hypothetical protein
MEYTKPQITNTENASLAIMSTQQKEPTAMVDGIELQTNAAYSADE